MNQPVNWEELEAQFVRENFEKSKSGSISFIGEKNKQNWEICLSHWEKLLSSDYWKNWQQKIKEFQNNNELDFYVARLSTLVDFIRENTIKGRVDQPDPEINTVSRLIYQEEVRLQNISSEDWKKEDKFSGIGLKEISDPREMSKLFGDLSEAIIKGEISERLDKSVNYKGWTKEQLTKEVEKLTFLTNELKKTENLDQSQIINRRAISQKLERCLDLSTMFLNSINNNNNNPWPITPIVFSISLIALLGLIVYKLSRKRIRRKSF